jgi:type III pantothenate kinase
VISHRKAFEGGAILPGVSLAVEALATKTAKLPFVDLVFPEKVIGKNTTDCIRAGILFGYCDMLDGLLERTVKEIGEPCTVVLTGGWGSVFQHRLKTPSKYLPHLTLEGIRILFELYSESIRQ